MKSTSQSVRDQNVTPSSVTLRISHTSTIDEDVWLVDGVPARQGGVLDTVQYSSWQELQHDIAQRILLAEIGPCQETFSEMVQIGWDEQSDPAFAERDFVCGTYRSGEKRFCEPCLRAYEVLYPQGWQTYPGDVCVHGFYTGGCGADRVCGACEAGDVE